MKDFILPSVGASFKKWGCCTPILPKCQELPHNTQKRSIKKYQKIWKEGANPQSDRPRATAKAQLLVAGPLFSTAASSFPSFCPHFFPHVVNSFSLTPAHARPAQTSSKIFKHP
jgi:hypothetical protein